MKNKVKMTTIKMDLITESYYIYCSHCKNKTNCYYMDFHRNMLCAKCELKINGARKGVCIYKPCMKCEPPKIYWYCEETFGEIKIDCGDHDVEINLFDDIYE